PKEEAQRWVVRRRARGRERPFDGRTPLPVRRAIRSAGEPSDSRKRQVIAHGPGWRTVCFRRPRRGPARVPGERLAALSQARGLREVARETPVRGTAEFLG